ncbi:hypothetical protein B0H21DRAFT_727492 [Amylocystis lapponica]|nr:hypothetical protein B0H21DRAFT_727492 [Amylocystis lapponica]
MTSMQITTGLALLSALGARLVLNTIFFPDQPSTAPNCLLTGLFQGVLLHQALIQQALLAIPVAIGIAAKLYIDFLLCCTLLGVALGVPKDRATSGAPYEPSRRIRLVSFGRSQERARPSRHVEPHSRTPRHEHGDGERHPRAVEHRTVNSLDSVPSSIDPDGRLTPNERAVAVLRARASLADSERRRFKEERKWALSQGNTARASQLAWQVRRYAALMESFHREADAKVVEAARAAAPQQPAPAPANPPRTRRTSGSQRRPSGGAPAPAADPAHAERQPLVSVHVSTKHHRKRGTGTTALRPAIRVQGRDPSRPFLEPRK